MDSALNDRPIIIGDIDLELLSGIDSYKDKWDIYNYNDIPVPRMSNILKETIGKDYLISYALKCNNYYYETEQILYIGTLVHSMIDEFLLNGKLVTTPDYRNEMIFNQTNKAYNNFVRWYNDKVTEGYTINPLKIEESITTPWFGGTIDCIMQITRPDGFTGNYIVDFKTSGKIAIDYLIQTYGYLWGVEWINRNNPKSELPNVNGIGIIRVDKKRKSYNDIFFTKGEDDLYLNNIHNGFVHCLNWFYYQKNLEWILKDKRGSVL